MLRLPGSIPLFTRLGNEIPNAQDPDLQPERAELVSARFRQKYPTADLRRPPCGQYNCHGLVFANRRTGIHRSPAISQIVDDDGYREVPRRKVEPGDLVVYYEGAEVSHTGVVLKVVQGAPETPSLRSARVVSKWGQAGEYVHGLDDAPYPRDKIRFWTDRP